ncbi:hypothetical protein GMORB2_2466 [Geosmithia morbida]|uniref:Protein-tyrosine-phosphatase n=1 Tax=Geosmithia morbida TaxID=1094350 RepID=A0A9P5D2N1_9HYPO|nr:uncharacterized protein GMORB2_2466 [Geosmithia morbida]KAF4120980.1 hypothetical protein GMORB2_2466 [Geosmithia morbida]
MATVALTRPISEHTQSSVLDVPYTSPLSLEGLNSLSASRDDKLPVPNKHLPACPTGPAVKDQLETPPDSPKEDQHYAQPSILYPPQGYDRLDSGSESVYQINATTVVEALSSFSRIPLAHPTLVFPWLHGLHPHNHIQRSFFSAKRSTSRRAPPFLRNITIVKADGDLSVSRLKGAIAPQEVIHLGPNPQFVEADPPKGFSVRNFHIQPAKVALTSDIIVYGDNISDVRRLAFAFASAQRLRREKHLTYDQQFPQYNTFICTSAFAEFEANYQETVAIDSNGHPTGKVLDFFEQERQEMWYMTQASEISHNVFLGPTPERGSADEAPFDILIECSDGGRLNPDVLKHILATYSDEVMPKIYHDFPSSGSILPPTYCHVEADDILETCKWIYHLAHGSRPSTESFEGTLEENSSMSTDGDKAAPRYPPRKILIHCADGYTESSMLGIAYFSYSTGCPLAKAWVDLHKAQGRNFFAYPSDVALLKTIAPRLLHESPACSNRGLLEISDMVREEPHWFSAMDGSLPSRVLDYLYLGNITHANNPDLLRELGICQVLSVGEKATWDDDVLEAWGEDNTCIVDNVQDNGIDPLTDQLVRCLGFIDRGRQNGTATLVHCRVGVSRSATICIAEVMRAMKMSFPRAYCFVRARRLNVIIQPHLRFTYELLRWEGMLQQDGDPDAPVKREMEWAQVTREIALMNLPYSR